MSKHGDEIRRLIGLIRDADDYDRAYAAAEGYVNQIDALRARLEAAESRLETATRLLEPLAKTCPQWLLDWQTEIDKMNGSEIIVLRYSDLRAAAAFIYEGQQRK